MPANLTPDYLAAEERYRQAKTPAEKIQALKEMYATIPKHKGTMKLQGDIRKRIAKHNTELQQERKAGKRAATFHVEKEGAGQVVLAGLPNVGKSQLVSSLTHASPEVAEYPFTTRMPHPAMMPFENIQIQLVDLPPISADHMAFWVPNIIRNSDGVLLMVDLTADPLIQTETSLEIMKESKLALVREEPEVDPWSSVAYKKTMIVANKNDFDDSEDTFHILKDQYSASFPILPVSAKHGKNLEKLKRSVYDMLGILRVHSKPPGKEAELDKPFILKRGCTLLDFAQMVHKDFGEKLRFARIWGSEKFDGQRVNKDYVLNDEDVIELHM
ncbi:MAG: 50S ribosome-binding GTPase [Gemmatimonadota bacterium]|nr:MAG: 50S ribosome-binding GTPase [Gemmatimonadota bacterium]